MEYQTKTNNEIVSSFPFHSYSFTLWSRFQFQVQKRKIILDIWDLSNKRSQKEIESDCEKKTNSPFSFSWGQNHFKCVVNFVSQFIWDDTNTILGGIRSGRFGQLRIGRHQNIHTILGHAYVWHLFCHQYRCATKSTHCHDESFISIDFRKFNIVQ